MNHYSCITLQLHNELRPKELFKPSEDMVTLLVWILKNGKFFSFFLWVMS